MIEHFVDRDSETRWLREFTDATPDRRTPAGVLIEGTSGIGKSALITRLESARDELPVDVYSVRCHPTIGPTSVFGAVISLYAQIEARAPKRPWKRKQVIAGVAQSTAAFAGELAPVLKPFIAAGAEAVKASLGSGSMPFDSLAPFEHAIDLQIAEVVAKRIGKRPTVVVVDDLHCCDARSLHVLELLLRSDRLPFGLVLCRDPYHPAGRAHELLLRIWETDGLIERRSLGALPSDAIADLVLRSWPDAPPTVAAELERITGGHPIFVVKYLEHWRRSHEAASALPATLEGLVGELLEAVAEEDRGLLARAASQGYWFDSATVADLGGEDRAAIRDRLHALARLSPLIEADEPPDWARRERADHYRFQHQALWHLVDAIQSAEQRRDHHERIALAAIDRLGDGASYEQRLEIASHLRAAEDHCWALSSDYHLALAQTAATEHLSLEGAEWLCGKAIDAAEEMRPNEAGRDDRLVRAAMVYLSLTEVRWKGRSQPTGERDTDRLAASAEAAAKRLGEPGMLTRATMMRGKTLMATQGLEPGLERLHRAVVLAGDLPDPTALYVAKIEYGRQVSKRDLAEGIRQLAEAEAMRRDDALIRDSADPVLVHARNLGEIQYGVSLFDDGKLGESLDRLEAAAHRLRNEGNRAELPIAFNYLAQARITAGEHEAAVELLREALRLEDERGGASGWHAYNRALLGFALAELGAPPAEVLDLMESAWAETMDTWLLNLVPIVRNLFADAALRAGRLDQAHRLATATVEETRTSGMVRSEIAAHMLLGRTRLAQGDTAGALIESDHSLDLLAEHGAMPALRSEEVYYNASVVYAATGNTAEADRLLELAREELERKARSFTDEAGRRRFETAPGLNRLILDGTGTTS